MTTEFSYRYEVLMKEWGMLQSSIQKYDDILFKIRGWSMAVLSAFIIASVHTEKPYLTLFSLIPICFFWSLDAMHKSFQRRFIIRSNRIEHFLRAGEFSDAVEKESFGDFHIPDLGGKFSVKNWKQKISPFKAALMFHVLLIYVPQIAIASFLFLILSFLI